MKNCKSLISSSFVIILHERVIRYMIKENQKYLNRIFIITDSLIILFSFILSWYIRFKSGWIVVDNEYLSFQSYLLPIIFALPVYLILYYLFKLYEPYRYKDMVTEFINILKANIISVSLFILILFLFKMVDYSRLLLFVFVVSSILITFFERILVRYTLRKIRKKGYNLKHILIIGYSNLTNELLERFNSNRHWGYNVLGMLDDNQEVNRAKINGEISSLNKIENAVDEEIAVTSSIPIKVLGKISKLESILNEKSIDEIFITLNLKEYDRLSYIISICEKHGIRTQIVPDYLKYLPAKPYVEEINGLPIINIRYVPLDNLVNRSIKRVFDILSSLFGIIIISPIMVITAIIIKLTSPGPILFKQERVGINNKTFMMYKFRSMRVQKVEEEKDKWTTKDDPRKTKFGSFIRKTSIDELPQLFNVLKGDMSLIGPRPERPYFVEQFKEQIPKYMIKHQVRPGITGWAQVNGWRGDTSIEKRIECDIYYIENWSIALDIKIIWLTLFKGFINKNAY